ncbi:MAG: hypothetical protein QOE11_1224, partial [Solirubrobacteraceae bacterium]|nr:hypothetical protein [Solirubrobacteraceae bacterium]
AGRPEPQQRRRERPGDPGPAAADTDIDDVPFPERSTEVVPASEARTDVVRTAARSSRDRAVTRADAEQLTFDAPAEDDEPALRPGDGDMPRRARDH